eukprot:GHVQ01013068.1.p1 GENE.GHVQ01013068.1~~GHVQ01013068.1.p1  ORF type:complete len:875 (+),score=85.87 GHVQ01013068.1:341-2626(+)
MALSKFFQATEGKTEEMHVINVILDEAARSVWGMSIYSGIFDPEASGKYFVGLENSNKFLWRGMKAHCGRVGGETDKKPIWTVNINAAAALAIEAGKPVGQLIKEDSYGFACYGGQSLDFNQKRTCEDFCRDQNERSKEKACIKGILKDLKIETCYIRPSLNDKPQKRTHKVFRLAPVTPLTHKFVVDGVETNVADFMKAKYGVKLEKPWQPCLQLMPKHKELMIPLELAVTCRQSATRSMNDTLKGQIAGKMIMGPGDRLDYINSIRGEVFTQNNAVLQQFQLTLEDKSLHVTGRILPPPSLTYGQSTLRIQDGAWQLRDKQFTCPVNKPLKWIVGIFQGCMSKMDAEDFASSIVKQSGSYGMKLPNWLIIHNIENENEAFDAFLQNCIKHQVQFGFFIIPDRMENSYGQIKRKSQQHFPSQVLKQKNGLGCSQKAQLMCNVLQKVNAKLGGVNQVISQPKNGGSEAAYWTVMENGAMVLAAAVQRPAVGLGASKLSPAVAALVGSLNNQCGQWGHGVAAQHPSMFHIEPDNLSDMMDSVMGARKKANGKPPKTIIYFRDGLSDKQFQLALEEVTVMRRWFESKGLPRPSITVIATQKNHNTRFFPENCAPGQGANLPPGYLLDNALSHLGGYENFYLLGHAGIIGTSHPTRYFILLDDNKFAKGLLHQFCYNMCHLFARCTRACSLPSPCMYVNTMTEKAWKLIVHSRLLASSDEFSVASEVSADEKTRLELQQILKNVDTCNKVYTATITNTPTMYYC